MCVDPAETELKILSFIAFCCHGRGNGGVYVRPGRQNIRPEGLFYKKSLELKVSRVIYSSNTVTLFNT
jgi:hypothetical protein